MNGMLGILPMLFAGIAGPLSVQTIHEDFTAHAPGLLDSSRWEVTGLGWHFADGRLRCEAGVRTTARPLATPHAAELTFETVLRPERPLGNQWKTAGIAIGADESNFWQLSLVEAPDTLARAHTVELHEMLRGHWLANIEGSTALTKLGEEGASFTWEYGRDYRLRLELTPQRITGTIEEPVSGRRWAITYSLTGDCVRAGMPMLSAASMEVSYASLHAEVRQAAPPPKRPRSPAYTLPPMSSVRRKPSGFFRVERIGPRWWVIDPNGAAFYVVGTDHVNYHAHWCEKLGYAPYSRNVQAKYGSEEKWAEEAARRLKAWGFNTLGAGHSESMRHRGLAHTIFLSLGTAFTAYGDIAPRTTWTGFPDVFDPRFAEFCAIEARKQCGPHKDDPWLLGYFLDNELEWFGKNGSETGLVDEVMKKRSDHPAKRAFLDLLRRRYAAIGDLNAAWKTAFPSWDDLAAAPAVPPTSGAALRDRRDFVRLIAERYFSITTASIRRADPNHMILGCRFAGIAPPVWDIAGKYLDIVSVNYYGTVDLDRGVTTDMPAAMERYYKEAQRPLLITEWSFPALDAGLPCRYGAGQRVPTQKDKARAYQIYQTALFRMPFMVGSDYFMWVDEPAQGISSTFPEDSNYGLVDVNDRPWPELTAMAARVNRKAVAIHAGDTAEVSAAVRGNSVLVQNTGRKEARFVADIWVQGRRKAFPLHLKPGTSQTLPLWTSAPALVVVELDTAGELAESRIDDNRLVRLIDTEKDRGRVVVANAGPEELTNVVLAVALKGTDSVLEVSDRSGRPLPSQVDRLPSGTELAFVAPHLPPRTATVFRLKRGRSLVSTEIHDGGNGFSFAGTLTLDWHGTSGNVLDSVRLGSLPVGRLTVLAHQVNGQPLWTEPARTVAATTWTGPVRTVRIVELEGGGGAEGARTQVDPQGTYAPRIATPGRFHVSVRLDCYPSEPWFDVRVLSVSNSDSQPWRLENYFVYPLSAIAGSAADDTPGGPGEAPRWYDSNADASYGAFVDTRVYRGYFWKDTPDGSGEHADIYRPVQRVLQPGEAFAPKPADPAVRVFAVKGDSAAPTNQTMARLRALTRLEVRVP